MVRHGKKKNNMTDGPSGSQLTLILTLLINKNPKSEEFCISVPQEMGNNSGISQPGTRNFKRASS